MKVARIAPLVALTAVVGSAVVASQDPVAVTLTIQTVAREGPIVRGRMQVAVVNHVDAALRQVSIRLEQPVGGFLGSGDAEGVSVEELPADGTAVAVVDYVLDESFLSSPDQCVVRVTYIDPLGESAEAVVVAPRESAGAQ